MAEEFEELEVEVINVPLEDGTEMECAIMDYFDQDGISYIVLSPIEGDDIGDEMFLYRYTEDGEDIILDYIDDEEEYNRVSKAYGEMLDEFEE